MVTKKNESTPSGGCYRREDGVLVCPTMTAEGTDIHWEDLPKQKEDLGEYDDLTIVIYPQRL